MGSVFRCGFRFPVEDAAQHHIANPTWCDNATIMGEAAGDAW
jgi:hypothetical protein